MLKTSTHKAEPKQKCPAVDVTGDGSKVSCCTEQYFIGTWDFRSMNQVNWEWSNILGISELKWIRIGEFNSADHYIYYCGQEFLRRNGEALIVNKRVWNAALGSGLHLGAISKIDTMISVHFQGKPFNITVIQVYTPTTNAEETEVEWFCEDLQDILGPNRSRRY